MKKRKSPKYIKIDDINIVFIVNWYFSTLVFIAVFQMYFQQQAATYQPMKAVCTVFVSNN